MSIHISFSAAVVSILWKTEGSLNTNRLCQLPTVTFYNFVCWGHDPRVKKTQPYNSTFHKLSPFDSLKWFQKIISSHFMHYPWEGKINTLAGSARTSLRAPRAITSTGVEKCLGSTGSPPPAPSISSSWDGATCLQTLNTVLLQRQTVSHVWLLLLTPRLQHTAFWLPEQFVTMSFY